MKKQDLIVILILSVFYFLFGIIRIESVIVNDIVSPVIFPSEGIALAFILYFGKKVWPGILLGQFLLAVANGVGYVPSFLIGLVNSFEALLAFYLFKYLNVDIKLQRFKDLIVFALLVIFVLQPFSALFSNLILYYFGYIHNGNLFESMYSWWFGNVMGQLVFTPAILSFMILYSRIKILEIVSIGIIYMLMLVLMILAFNIKSALFLLVMSLPVILVEVYVRNISYGLFIVVLLSFALILLTYNGYGPFVYQNEVNVFDYNIYMLTLTVTLLVSNVIFQRQKNFQKILQDSVEKALEKNKQQQILMLQQNKLAQMGEMIGMIAHQWRQPLNNLSLLQQMLVDKYKKGKLNDYFINYFNENSKKQINMMSKTIDDFRNFFKPNENKKFFSVDEVIENIISMVNDIFNQKGIRIEYIKKASFNCYGFPNSLSHAILNIINNAKDALIEKNIENKNITIVLYKDDSKAVLEIKDNAGGIDEKIIDKIFEPYFSTKTEKNGTGLGLYMTKMIIEQYLNSEIIVYNNKEGAVFKIVLDQNICSENKNKKS